MSALPAHLDNISTLDIEQVYSRQEGSRDFTKFPTVELNQLVEIIENERNDIALRVRLEDYFQKLHLIGAEVGTQALIGHVIASYLRKCIETGEPWSAKFLFPPELNPQTTALEINGESQFATKHFQDIHLVRNIDWISQYLKKVVLEPTILFINGPMYSAKSGEASMLHGAISSIVGKDNISTMIFAPMDEKAIHARSLPNANIPAKQVTLEQFEIQSAKLIRKQHKDHDTKRVVIVEEATFFSADPNNDLEQEKINAQAFCAAVQRLQQAGISVILIGLDKNYRATDLPITDILRNGCTGTEFLDCTSYHLHRNDEGVTVSEAERTGRYSKELGMFDLLFPILVPRDLGDQIGIEYVPLPAKYHPIQVLADHDPELHQVLINVQRPDLLDNHTKLVLEKSGTES